MNSVQLIGRLTRDPEIRYTSGESLFSDVRQRPVRNTSPRAERLPSRAESRLEVTRTKMATPFTQRMLSQTESNSLSGETGPRAAATDIASSLRADTAEAIPAAMAAGIPETTAGIMAATETMPATAVRAMTTRAMVIMARATAAEIREATASRIPHHLHPPTNPLRRCRNHSRQSTRMFHSN